MNRSEAIDDVIAYVDRINGEWGSGGSTDNEVAEVLTALGVTRDELVAHNVIGDGYWHHILMSVAGKVAAGAPYDEVAREIAVSLSSSRKKESRLRNLIFDGLEKGAYGE